ncbi:MAG: Uma2 family endonuclease [Myxococcales bacterium]|nr:Uma2 family endonuclease [Myxococcales bacterium]
MTYADYLAFERASDTKHEYANGLVYAMAGGTPQHGRLAMRLGRLIGNGLSGRPCDTFSSDVRVRVEATGRSTYPDLSVVCGPRVAATDDPDSLTNPVLIAEVLSESTEAGDRGEKWAHYQRLASLKEYVLVSQLDAHVEVFRRRDDGEWTYASYRDGEVELASIGVRVSIAELYADPTG